MKMEIYEKGKNVVVEIPALDLDMKDIEVDIKKDCLKVKCSKKITKEAKKEGYYAKEEKEKLFYNEVKLPFSVKADKVKKELKQGVLKISVPKK